MSTRPTDEQAEALAFIFDLASTAHEGHAVDWSHVGGRLDVLRPFRDRTIARALRTSPPREAMMEWDGDAALDALRSYAAEAREDERPPMLEHWQTMPPDAQQMVLKHLRGYEWEYEYATDAAQVAASILCALRTTPTTEAD